MKRYNHNIRKGIKNMQAQNEYMQNVERFKETDFYKCQTLYTLQAKPPIPKRKKTAAPFCLEKTVFCMMYHIYKRQKAGNILSI